MLLVAQVLREELNRIRLKRDSFFHLQHTPHTRPRFGERSFDWAKQGCHRQLASVSVSEKKDRIFAASMMLLPGTAGESEHSEHRAQIFRKWEEAYQATKSSTNDRMLAYRDNGLFST